MSRQEINIQFNDASKKFIVSVTTGVAPEAVIQRLVVTGSQARHLLNALHKVLDPRPKSPDDQADMQAHPPGPAWDGIPDPPIT